MSSIGEKAHAVLEKAQEQAGKVQKKFDIIEKRANAIMPDFEDSTPDVLKRKLTVRVPFLRMN